MSHSHSFGREADGMSWDADREVAVIERRCQEYTQSSGVPASTLSGGTVVGGGREQPCEAVQKTAYEIRSVVDYHNEHPGTHCVVVSEDGRATTDGARHISEFDDGDVPEWVGRVEELAQGSIESRDVGLMMCSLSGPEFSMTLATSETEYNVTFSKVDEWVEEV